MNAIDLKDRTAIVTGGARGIGFAIAKRMLASGATVVLWDVDAAALDKAGAELQEHGNGDRNGGGRVHAAVVNVTDAAAIARAAAADLRERGKIDVLVNNAGITRDSMFHRMKPEQWAAVIGTNLSSLFNMCRPVIEGHGVAIAHDVTSEPQWKALIQKTLQTYGRLDILVNNAGITGGNAPLWELAPEVWGRVVEVNLVAPYLTCRAIVPHMVRAGYGRIVNIASIAGKEGNPNASHYSASKAGLIALTKSLAKELAATGVVVNCVTPAAAKTELFAQMKQEHIDYMLSKIPMNRFVEVEEIAALVAWLASEDCSFSTGAVFDISGGRAVY